MFENNLLSEVTETRLNSRLNDVITRLRFDDHYELLWAGTETGRMYVLECPSLEPYAWFRSHKTRVEDIIMVRGGCLSISKDTIRLHSQGGRPKLTFNDTEGDLLCCCMDPCDSAHRSNKIVVGRRSGYITFFDIKNATKLNSVDLRSGSVTSIRNTISGYIACGTASGDIHLLDARANHKHEHLIDKAHPEGIRTISCRHNLLASCGYKSHSISKTADTDVKVYDIRMTCQPVIDIYFASGPAFLAFHPKFSGTLLIASTFGVLDVWDVQVDAPPQNFKIGSDHSVFRSLDISCSGDFVALGTETGVINLWASQQNGIVNLMSATTQHPPRMMIKEERKILDENASFAVLPLQSKPGGKWLSDYISSTPISVGLPPKTINDSLLKELKQVDFVGYAPNPEYFNGLEYGIATQRIVSLRNFRAHNYYDMLSQTQNYIHSPSATTSAPSFPLTLDSDSDTALPEMYYPVEIRTPSMSKFKEFNFKPYNYTPLTGLENGIHNSYCNSLLQVLYFQVGFRKEILKHVPDADNEICITDEMSFLFKMLAAHSPEPCQASNYFRAMNHFEEIVSLDVLNDSYRRDSNENTRYIEIRKLTPLERISRTCKFFLEQLHRECQKLYVTDKYRKNSISRLFGLKYSVYSVILDKTKDIFVFQIDMSEKVAGDGMSNWDFCTMLDLSIFRRNEISICMDQQKNNEKFKEPLIPQQVPETMVMSTGVLLSKYKIKSEDLMPFYFAIDTRPSISMRNSKIFKDDDLDNLKSAIYLKSGASYEEWVIYELTAVIFHIRNNPGRIGYRNKKDHYIAHIKVDPQDLDDKENAMNAANSNVALMAASQVLREDSICDFMEDDSLPPGILASLDDLGISCTERYIKQNSEAKANLPDNLDDVLGILPTTNIKEGKCEMRGCRNDMGSASFSEYGEEVNWQDIFGRRWVLFNDFTIKYTGAEEVRKFFNGKKDPCLLFYTKVSDYEDISIPSSVPIPDSAYFYDLCHGPPLQGSAYDFSQRKFQPLDMGYESPKSGDLFALDTEFIVSTLPFKPDPAITAEYPAAKLIVGRVSVVRGDGKLAGVCCIDDYIRPLEPIQDYLTRFSGLTEEDLDIATSTHYLTTLKKTYVKLRYLVDCGCIFVGHGLRKDFRTINMIVPPEQIIDTVELFHIVNQRKLSLRFLASYLLNIEIQSNVHDSIEDACTALKLYNAYQELVAAGEYEDKVKEMYHWGAEHGWDPNTWQTSPHINHKEKTQ